MIGEGKRDKDRRGGYVFENSLLQISEDPDNVLDIGSDDRLFVDSSDSEGPPGPPGPPGEPREASDGNLLDGDVIRFDHDHENRWNVPQTAPFIDVGGTVYNIRAFGAVPGQDATTAIQSAVDSAAVDGGTVLVGVGRYPISAPLLLAEGVVLHIQRGAALVATAAIHVVQLEPTSQIILDGEIDLRGFAATGIYADGASEGWLLILGWNSANQYTAISGEGRIFGDYTVGQTGIHLFADGVTAGANISFLRVCTRTHRCYYGVRLQALNKAYINGNILDVDVAGAVYAWHLDERTGGGIGVSGNLIRGEIQTVPETQRAVYVDGDANTFILVVWDWKIGRAGFPVAIELKGIHNRLITNQLPAEWFARGSATNIIDNTHWRKHPEFKSLAPGGFFNEAFAGVQDDMLLGAHRRHSVTTSFGAGPAVIAELFNADPSDKLPCTNCATGNPQSVTVTLAAPDNGIAFIGVHFGQSRRALKVAISVDTTGSGNWVDLLNMNTTPVDFGVIATVRGKGVTIIYAIRVTFEGYVEGQTAVWLCRLWAFSRTPGSLFVPDSVSGSRSGGAALANLLTILATKGIISDDTGV